MTGIYKITTPSNYVYIGQSVNIKKRWNEHKWPTKRSVSLIGRSINKYGYKNHSFELLHELPADIDKKTLSAYESLYMDLYRNAGFLLLNISDAKDSNYGYVPSEETRKRHSEKMKGRPSPRKGKTHTENSKIIIKEKRALQTNIKGRPLGNIPWNKGLKGAQVAHNKGISPTDEVKEKIRQKLLGSKLSPETIAKRTATLKINGVKRRWSEEAKKRQSEKYLGKTKSAETIEKGRATRLLKKLNLSNAIQK